MKNLFFAFLFVATNSFAQEQKIDPRIANQEIAKKLLNTVGGCGERIWPGYDLKSLNVVLVDNVSDELLAVSIKENMVFKINASTLPNDVKLGLFSFFNIGAQAWMSINTEKNALFNKDSTQDELISDTFRLTIHEAFHQTTQSTWNDEAISSRGTFVPIKWEPRYFRSMIYKNLVLAYNDKTNSKLSLQRAKYWFEKWSKDFPEEVLSTTDGYEGTAQYAEVIAMVLANLSCKASEEKINDFILDGLANDITGNSAIFSGYIFKLDGEGYEMGVLASLVLRQNNSIQDWQTQIANGKTPLVILMENIPSQFEDFDEKLKVRFLETQKKEQSKADKHLAETYLTLNSEGSYLVSIPRLWKSKSGSTSYLGFYVDHLLSLQFRVLGQGLSFQSEDGNSSLNSNDGAVYIDLELPCKENSPWNFPVSGESVSIDASKILTVNNKNFNGTLAGKLIKDKNGKNWFCAGEN